LVEPAVYHGDNMQPEGWEQNPWCEVHPYVRAIREWVTELAEQWWNEADANEDVHPSAARAVRACSSDLHKLLRGS
jgi:hypothetical protein